MSDLSSRSSYAALKEDCGNEVERSGKADTRSNLLQQVKHVKLYCDD